MTMIGAASKHYLGSSFREGWKTSFRAGGLDVGAVYCPGAF